MPIALSGVNFRRTCKAMNKTIPSEQANLIFDILIEECGAAPSMRTEFVREHGKEPWYWPTEFRFQGLLGFGGKFWNEYNNWRVSCYPENETQLVKEYMQKANERLASLRIAMEASSTG